MSIEGISINLEEVRATAKTIKTLNSKLATRLDDIKKEMNSLESTWQSQASSTIRTNFNKLESKFQECRKIIDSYGTFLETTVDSYTNAESSINSNASAFE